MIPAAPDLGAFLPFARILWDFLNMWWWVFAPFLLFGQFKWFWMFWRVDVYDATEPRILLEFRFPQNVEKPIQAMENVWGGFWQVYDPPNTREWFFEGKYQLSMSVEIVSTEGDVRFYARIAKSQRQIVESALYSQFPDAELIEVPDYVRKVPQNIPNKDWKLWGATFRLDKDNYYPIRTYPSFESNPEAREEKRVDPMTIIVEALSNLGEGEHLWIQFLCEPFGAADSAWPKYVEDGKKFLDVLLHRSSAANGGAPHIPITEDFRAAFNMAATGQDVERRLAGGAEEEQGLLAPELRLSPGEREVVMAIEQKLSKNAFKVTAQFAYFAKIDKYFGPAKALPFSYLNQYTHATMNFFRPLKTVKVHTIPLFFLDRRRGYLNRRKIFKSLVWRLSVFPYLFHDRMVLNTEEMASLFHFPSRITYPSGAVPRVETRKGEAPPGIPLEE